jgi:transcriptional regulator with XRE-family HTH domain
MSREQKEQNLSENGRSKPSLGQKVQQYLKTKGMDQATLAQLSGLNPSAVSRLINGKRDWLVHHLQTVARALEMAPEALLKGTEQEPDLISEILEFVPLADFQAAESDKQEAEQRARGLEETLKIVEAERDALRTRNAEESVLIEQSQREIARLQQELKQRDQSQHHLEEQFRQSITIIGQLKAQAEQVLRKNEILEHNLRERTAQRGEALRAVHEQNEVIRRLKQMVANTRGKNDATVPAVLLGGLLGAALKSLADS